MHFLDHLLGKASKHPVSAEKKIAGDAFSAEREAVEPAADPGGGDFIQRLNNVLSAHSNAVSGRLHMIGLDQVKPFFGDRWERVAEKVHAVARLSIERRLTGSDIYTRYGDLNYMIVFGSLSRPEAQVKCALIAREIAEKLLGTQSAAKMMKVSCVSVKKDGQLLFNEIGDLDSLIREFDAQWAEQQAADNAAAVSWQVEEDIERAWAALKQRISYIYRPVWNVRNQAITTYLCLPAVVDEHGEMLVGYNIFPPGIPKRYIAYLDSMMLHKAAMEMTWLENSGKQLLLSVPVHYETLANTRSRMNYINYCHEIPKALRRYLMLELVGVMDGTPSGRLIELTSTLCAECRAMLVRLPLGFSDFEALRPTRIRACGLAIDENSPAETKLFAEFDRFCEGVEGVRRQKYIHGLSSSSLLAAALGAGFDYVDGETIASMAEEPTSIRQLRLGDIFFGDDI